MIVCYQRAADYQDAFKQDSGDTGTDCCLDALTGTSRSGVSWPCSTNGGQTSSKADGTYRHRKHDSQSHLEITSPNK
jgi:hypothetical protein